MDVTDLMGMLSLYQRAFSQLIPVVQKRQPENVFRKFTGSRSPPVVM